MPTAVLNELAGLRILLVEDHEDTREGMAIALKTRGAVIATAASAAEGRDALTRFDAHVIISDIGMPGEDGYAFIRRLRSEEGRVARARRPAVALTAHAT